MLNNKELHGPQSDAYSFGVLGIEVCLQKALDPDMRTNQLMDYGLIYVVVA